MLDLMNKPTHKVRVLHLLAGCRMGGLERVALSIVSALNDQFAFQVVVYDDDAGPLRPEFDAIHVPVTFLPRKPGVDLTYPIKLSMVLRREKIDVIHAHNGTALFYGVMAAKLAGGRRLVFTAHDRTVPQVKVRPIQRMLGRATSRAVAVSDLGRQDLLTVEGFDPGRIVVVRNGADAGDIDSAPTREAARTDLGIPVDAEVVGTVARLHREKNVPLLVRAFARVAAERPLARLVIAGDGPERVPCLEAARETGVSERVMLLGTRRDIGRVLAALDVFALSSDAEGLPLAVLEAMGAGRPVVSTDVGAIREVVSDGVNGRLVRPGDEAAMAAALAETLGNPERAREMGRRGREVFLSGFTVQRMAADYGRVYRESMEGAL